MIDSYTGSWKAGFRPPPKISIYPWRDVWWNLRGLLGATFQRTSLIYSGTAGYMSIPPKINCKVCYLYHRIYLLWTRSTVQMHRDCFTKPKQLRSLKLQFISVQPTRPPHIQMLCLLRLAHGAPLSSRVATATRICSSPDWLVESELARFLFSARWIFCRECKVVSTVFRSLAFTHKV